MLALKFLRYPVPRPTRIRFFDVWILLGPYWLLLGSSCDERALSSRLDSSDGDEVPSFRKLVLSRSAYLLRVLGEELLHISLRHFAFFDPLG